MRAKIVAGLIVLLALVVLPMLPEGAVRQALGGKEPQLGSIHDENVREAPVPTGYFTGPDRAFACVATETSIGCDNGLTNIFCENDRCTGTRIGGQADVSASDALAPSTKMIPAKTLLTHPLANCFVERDYIECHLADYGGGFVMSGLFARVDSYDDGPPGWPWDGRRYTVEDRMPGI